MPLSASRWLFAGAILVTTNIFAVPPDSRREPSPSATPKEIARLIEAHYHNARTLQALFLERYSDGPNSARIESGHVYFSRPGRMRWEYDSPESKVFVSDGKTVWFYVPADRVVTRVPVKQNSDWRQPLALLTGKVNLSRLCDRIEIQKQPGIPASNVVLRCIPKGEKDSGGVDDLTGGDFAEVLLEVNSATGELVRVEVRQRGGIELEYRFGDWHENLPLADDLFRFHPPAGVAIVDAPVGEAAR